MVKAITFDVGGTLATGGLNKRAYQKELFDLLSSRGIKISIKELKKAINSALNSLNKIRSQDLEMDFRDFRCHILLRLGVTPTDDLLDEMAKIYMKWFEQEPVPRCSEVLEALSKEYRLGIISNTMSLSSKFFLEKYGLSSFFPVQIYSGEVGYRKPHPKIFQAALNKLSLPPEEVVHVGDLIEEDVRGPKKVGMKAILVGKENDEADISIFSLSELPRVVRSL